MANTAVWSRAESKSDPRGNIRYGSISREKFISFAYDAGREYPLRVEAVGVTYPDRQYFIERAHADYFTLEYVVSGKGYVESGGKTYTAEEDAVYLLAPGGGHRYGADRGDPYEKIWINFFSGVFTDVLAAYGLSGRVVFPRSGCKKFFEELIEVAETCPDNDLSCLRCSEIVYRIVFALAAGGSMESAGLAASVKQSLDAAVYRKVTVGELAAQLNISKSQLTREFRKRYGLSPYQYLLGRKIYIAEHLLRSTPMKVAQIASSLGFDDEYYFSNLFKAKTGMSPLAFRRGSAGTSDGN